MIMQLLSRIAHAVGLPLPPTQEDDAVTKAGHQAVEENLAAVDRQKNAADAVNGLLQEVRMRHGKSRPH